MSDDKEQPLVDITGISKPSDTLIKKVSAAVGGVFETWHIKRVAKAKAEASLIAARADIEVTDLKLRAASRWFEEEARRQANMEGIIEKATAQLNPEADPREMEDDWITNFFDKSRIISDDQMQGIWASVLAGEANQPGSYSKRTVNLLGDLDKRDAEAFVALFRFAWRVNETIPLVFNADAPIYNDNGVDFGLLSHLDSIGLVRFSNLASFCVTGLPKRFSVAYGGRTLTLEMPKDTDNDLTIGKVVLTQSGKELARVCSAPTVDGFEEYVKSVWKKHLSEPATTEQVAPADPPSEGG